MISFIKIISVFILLSIVINCSKKNLKETSNDSNFKKEINNSKNSFLIKELNKHKIKPSKLFIIEEIEYPNTYTYIYDEFSNNRYFVEGKVYSNDISFKNIDQIKNKDYFLFDYYEEIILFLKKNEIQELKNIKNLHYTDENYTYFEILDFENKSYLKDSVKYFGDNFEANTR